MRPINLRKKGKNNNNNHNNNNLCYSRCLRHLKSHKSNFFSPKSTIFLHVLATCSKLPYNRYHRKKGKEMEIEGQEMCKEGGKKTTIILGIFFNLGGVKKILESRAPFCHHTFPRPPPPLPPTSQPDF